MPVMAERQNLFGLEQDRIEALVLEKGHPAYRARQIYHWMYARGVDAFGEMTNLPAALRRELADNFVMERPSLAGKQSSRDGTVKYIFSLEAGNSI